VPKLRHGRYGGWQCSEGDGKRFYDPDIKRWMNKFQIKRILDRRTALITGVIPGAVCEAVGNHKPPFAARL
jgi:hypothetical protein